ncbi:TrmB family transcriptional regulator [Haloplanus halophilus]|uniref:TrmB family transcriptional regulator n=1 Tax=Haloplanus halophilus TaxID=2949993 RepID=UPI00203CCBA0|nr:TrmB family transcriptional regulator [Haloplanus sp. GDY1]
MSTNLSANATIAPTTDSLDVPDELTAADSKLVYLFVTVSDGVTVDELQSSLDIRKISLFPVLDTLSDRGLIDRIDDEYVAAS